MTKIIDKIKNRLHYYRYLQPSKVESVFVVSTGRTGTKFFESFFNAIDDKTIAVHEPQPDFFDLGMNKLREGWTKNQIEEYIKKHRAPYLRQFSGEKIKRYVECNPFMPVLLDEVKSVFKKSKFIIITREPKSYVKSALNKSPLDDGKMYVYGENDGRLRLRALDYEDDMYFDEWSSFSRLEKISWYWNKCNLTLLDFLKNNKGLLIKYENIFNENLNTRAAEMKKVLSFLKIEASDLLIDKLVQLSNQKKNNTIETVFGGAESWQKNELDKFEELTREANTLIYGK